VVGSLVSPSSSGSAFVFWHYLEISIWPGMFLTNLPLFGQLSMQTLAAYLQAAAESRVRRSQPDRFAPTVGSYLSRAYRQWAALHKDGRGMHGRCWLDDVFCGPNSFVHFVRLQMQQLKAQQKEYAKRHGSKAAGLTGIDSRVFTRGRSVTSLPPQLSRRGIKITPLSYQIPVPGDLSRLSPMRDRVGQKAVS
jgi:hypothetical protein